MICDSKWVELEVAIYGRIFIFLVSSLYLVKYSIVSKVIS